MASQSGNALAVVLDKTTILRFRHLLERHDLAPDTLRVVNDLSQNKGLFTLKACLRF